MTNQSNTQAAPMQGLSAWLRMLASHQSKYMSQDAATLLTWAAEVDAAQPTPEPVAPDNNVTVTSPSGSTWEVDPKWAPALQAALDGRREPVALQDENLVAMAWNTVRAEARTLIGPTGLSGLLTAVEQYGDRRAAQAARASLPAGFTPEQVAELVAARDKILAASLPAGGVVESDYKQAIGSTNCMQCAAAYMLGVPLADVPDFERAGSEAWEAFYKFFVDHGFTAEMLPPTMEIDGDYLASGDTARGTNHMVVMRGGKLLHDPHPSNAGLKSVQVVWLITRKAAAPQPSETQGRRQMTLEQQADAFAEAPSFGFDVLAAFGAGIEAAERHHGIPASPQDGGGQA